MSEILRSPDAAFASVEQHETDAKNHFQNLIDKVQAYSPQESEGK